MSAFEGLKAAFEPEKDGSFAPVVPGSRRARALGPYLEHYGLEHDGLDHRGPGPLWPAGGSLAAGFIHAGPFTLWCQTWTPPAPVGTALVVHGYFDHLGLYRHLLAWLLARSFRVVLWDLPGHGLSSGARSSIKDFAAYGECLQAVQRAAATQEAVAGPWVGIGQSTGAAILATDALRRGGDAPWHGLALLAPLVRPYGWRRVRVLHRLLAPWLDTFPRYYWPNSTDAGFVDFLRHEDPLQHWRLSLDWVSAMRRWMPRLEGLAPRRLPVLMLQGEEDYTVDWRYNLAVLADKFPGARTYRHPEARHHLVNEAPPIREALFAELGAFLDQQLAASRA